MRGNSKFQVSKKIRDISISELQENFIEEKFSKSRKFDIAKIFYQSRNGNVSKSTLGRKHSFSLSKPEFGS